ncbi:MAG: competence/damage-inducible protein A, partial [Sphingopyxis sp.]|nr:competence/damage-inducible protein A [Sphingopyxis sp.]
LVAHTIGAWAPESEIADLLRLGEKEYPGVAIGSYPFFREGRTGANFVIRSTDGAAVAACAAMLTAGLEALGYAVTDGGI